MTYNMTEHDLNVPGSEHRIVRIPALFASLVNQPSNLVSHQFDSGHMTRLSPISLSPVSYKDGSTIMATAGYMIVVGNVNGPVEGCWYAGNLKDAAEFYEELVNEIHKGASIATFDLPSATMTLASLYMMRDKGEVIYEPAEAKPTP